MFLGLHAGDSEVCFTSCSLGFLMRGLNKNPAAHSRRETITPSPSPALLSLSEPCAEPSLSSRVRRFLRKAPQRAQVPGPRGRDSSSTCHGTQPPERGLRAIHLLLAPRLHLGSRSDCGKMALRCSQTGNLAEGTNLY